MLALLGGTGLHCFVFPHLRVCGRVHVHHGVHTGDCQSQGFICRHCHSFTFLYIREFFILKG